MASKIIKTEYHAEDLRGIAMTEGFETEAECRANHAKWMANYPRFAKSFRIVKTTTIAETVAVVAV